MNIEVKLGILSVISYLGYIILSHYLDREVEPEIDPESIKRIDFLYDTTDTTYPAFKLLDENYSLTFMSESKHIKVQFSGYLTHKWDRNSGSKISEKFCNIEGSPWLQEITKENSEKHLHFMLDFKQHGQFHIIAKAYCIDEN